MIVRKPIRLKTRHKINCDLDILYMLPQGNRIHFKPFIRFTYRSVWSHLYITNPFHTSRLWPIHWYHTPSHTLTSPSIYTPSYPLPLNTYISLVHCYTPKGRNQFGLQIFHLSEWLARLSALIWGSGTVTQNQTENTEHITEA